MKISLPTAVLCLAGALLVGGLAPAVAGNGDTSDAVQAPPRLAASAVAEVGPPAGSIPASEEQFVNVKTCVIVDTRKGGGVLAKNSTREFRVRGTASFAGQGGKNGGCGIPQAATSVSMHVVALTPSAAGWLSAYAVGNTTTGEVGFLSAAKGQRTTATPTQRLAPSDTEPSLAIRTSAQMATHLLIEVTGYTIKPMHALVSGTGTIYSGTERVQSAVVNDVGNITVTVDRDVTYCTPRVSPYYPNYYATVAALSGSTVNVRLWTLSSGSPTPVSTYFYLSITC